MNFVAELNCPQYVNFKEEFNNKYDSLLDAEDSSCSIEESMESENMLVDDDSKSYYSQEDKISYSENIQSTQSLCYTPNSSCQQSKGDPDCQSKEFSVNHLSHLSLPEKGSKKIKTSKSDLNDSRKRKREYECNEYVPLAEQVAAFQRKTPKRFHTTGPRAFKPVEHWSPQLVCAKSPNLKTAKRRRGVNVLSREEQEAKEAEEMKRYQFHAQPVRYDTPGYSQLPNVEKKALTKPQHLNLRTAQRAAEINSKKKEEENPYEFRARPMPKAIITGPTGLKEKPPLHLTRPQTPNFALKSRAQKWKSEKKLKELCSESPKFKAMPAPPATSHFVVKHEKKLTEIQPFSFEEKDKERQAKKEKKINQEMEKENRVFVFKAQPMPSSLPSALPVIPKKPATHPEPFNLYTDNRSSKQNSSNILEGTCKSFKAKPATVLQKPPFAPEKPPKLIVETKEFHLHTEVRAVVHQKLKEEMDIKEQEKAQLLEELRQKQEEEERQEIAKLRKEAVHKANPIRNYKPFELKPCHKSLTTPKSPKFFTDGRIQLRHQK